MSENWPYVPKNDQSKSAKDLEKEYNKVKEQLVQTLLNANKTVIHMQTMQDELNDYQLESSKLKSQIAVLKKEIDKLESSKLKSQIADLKRELNVLKQK
jgi:chromosome segregation ATPase